MSIYMLTSPIAGDRAAYVGATKNPAQRYRAHLLADGPDRLRLWIAGLKDMGKRPVMTILDTCTVDEVEQAEEDCIAIIRAVREDDLLNHWGHHPYRDCCQYL